MLASTAYGAGQIFGIVLIAVIVVAAVLDRSRKRSDRTQD